MPKGKEEGLLKLEIFNNLAENLKNSKIVEKFMEELNNTLERNNSENIINNKNLTTEYRDKMLIERNEILQKYAEKTIEKGDMYYIYDQKDTYLATLCNPENTHKVIKIAKNEVPQDATIGSVLHLENEAYIVDKETTNLVKEELNNLLDKLLEEQNIKMAEHRVEGHLYEFVEKDNDKVSLIDITKNDGEVFEEFDFPKELLNNISEGSVIKFEDGIYKN